MSKVAEVEERTSSGRIGWYFCILQLVFNLGWTVYVIYLPKLAAQVGIAPATVILILMMDQAIFTVTDTLMGIAADRIAAFVGRLGKLVAVVTTLSCAAFVALPFVAGTGPKAQIAFVALIVFWAITSSALRAPPLVLIGRYRSKPAIPFLAALAMLGYGIAGAVSPYLGVVLRDWDARLPFVISSAVLLLVAFALSRVERESISERGAANGSGSQTSGSLGIVPMVFIGSTIILALGFQVHFNINSAPFYLRFAPAADLQWLMPVFWIGFNVAMLPASAVTKRHGGVIVMGVAGVLGALSIVGAVWALNLQMLIAAQFLAGAAWGCMLMSAVSAALAIGQTGSEGKVTGLVFSVLAFATFARLAAVAGGLQKMPDFAPLLHWTPVACWLVAGAGLLVLAAAHGQRRLRPNTAV